MGTSLKYFHISITLSATQEIISQNKLLQHSFWEEFLSHGRGFLHRIILQIHSLQVTIVEDSVLRISEVVNGDLSNRTMVGPEAP